nr:N-6 DNA methylase [Kineosporia babensis]
MDGVDPAKARGAYFTPVPIARYVARWAMQGGERGGRMLEPAAGDAPFLLAAAESAGSEWLLDGVERHPAAVSASLSALEETGARIRITRADFFMVAPTGDYDAVVGNPPYVRFHDFTGTDRIRAQNAARRAGVELTGLASSWAAFTVHAAGFLRPGGRLGLVLPAELLSVNYAAPVRRYLLENFARVRLVAFTERVFPGVVAEIMLLLAEGYGQAAASPRLETVQVRNAAELEDLALDADFASFAVPAPEQKWTSALIPAEPLRAFAQLPGAGFGVLDDWGKVSLGIVTGNNGYFALNPAQAAGLGLGPADLLPLSPPGSAHLRQLEFSAQDLAALGQTGSATWLFRPGTKRSPAAVAYVRAGEKMGVDEAYKCRIRSPWWQVRLVEPPDLLLTYMNADAARLVTNTARAHHLNSVHGVHLHPGLGWAADLLPLAALSSATLLGGETVGRSYGGGLLKLEPSEAKRLPLPGPSLLKAAAPALSAVRADVAFALSRFRLADAVKLVDEALLGQTLQLPAESIQQIRSAHAHLRRRRQDRGRTRI